MMSVKYNTDVKSLVSFTPDSFIGDIIPEQDNVTKTKIRTAGTVCSGM